MPFDSPNPTLERRTPTRREAWIFRAKTLLLQGRRMASDRAVSKLRRHTKGTSLVNSSVIARSITPLWTESDPRERELLAGKVQNLRIAIRHLNGVEVGPGETLSFWKQVGRASRIRGFVAGRELREGCIIPTIGGGLCQVSNALYDAALQAGFEIVERHRHSAVIPGSLAESGRDATVFWNYIDLRFRSRAPFRIEAKLDSENLTITFRGEKPKEKALHQITSRVSHITPNSCATCEVGDCHRVITPSVKRVEFGKRAWLLDESTPEFAQFVKREAGASDVLFVPLDGKRFRKANYAWPTDRVSDVKQSLWATAIRSYTSRKLSAQGAARQRNLLETYESLAASYARKLRFDAVTATIQQNLLPHIWSAGHLGGREFDVLMNGFPMAELQRRLDEAASLHPESRTLADFRADQRLIDAETEALAAAKRIVTPHREVAKLFGERAVLIEWDMPEASSRKAGSADKPVVVFPASTVGRKGCYELREALDGLDVRLITLGPLIEGEDFWKGFDASRGDLDWVERASLVVLPAFIENRPRRLLLAAKTGVPVLASAACGVEGIDGIDTVAAGDAESLRSRIVERLNGSL